MYSYNSFSAHTSGAAKQVSEPLTSFVACTGLFTDLERGPQAESDGRVSLGVRVYSCDEYVVMYIETTDCRRET